MSQSACGVKWVVPTGSAVRRYAAPHRPGVQARRRSTL